MQSNKNLTLNEIKQKMKTLAEGYTYVRLFFGDNIIACYDEKGEIKAGNCYDIFKEKTRCADCVARRTLSSKKSEMKVELRGDDFYFVKTKYLESEGKSYVIELINKFKKSEASALLLKARYSSVLKGDGKELSAGNASGEEESEIEKSAYKPVNGAFDDFSGGRSKSVSDGKNGGYGEYFEKIYKDALGICFNRRYYEEKIKNKKIRAAVAILDVDDFKLYNDVYGHSMGDSVIKIISGEIKRLLRENDELVRFGGDEFLIIMPDIAESAARDLLNRVRVAINKAQIPFYSEIKLSASIGGAMSAVDEIIEKTVEKADALMYRAKKEKNVVAFEYVKNGLKREKLNVLIVDDSELNREILSSILKNEFNVIEAGSGEECVEILKRAEKEIAVVLLDLIMPGLDGFAVLEYMNVTRLIERTPVIMITGDESGESLSRAYDLGVVDYITRPFDVKVVYRRVASTLLLYKKQMRLVEHANEQTRRTRKTVRAMVDILGKIVEYHAFGRGYHLAEVHRLTLLLLKALAHKTDKYKLGGTDVETIAAASIYHDIGKVALNPALVKKTENITESEREIIKTHTLLGAQMLDELGGHKTEPLIKYACEICKYHHERYDGSGYPCGLKGDETPISAQVVGAVTSFMALVSGAADKNAYSPEQTVEIMKSGKFGKFNPIVLDCLKNVCEKPSEKSGDEF